MKKKRSGGFAPLLCNLLGTLMLLAVILTALPLTVPRLLGYEAYGVVSGSMEPGIPVGSVIYVGYAVPEDVEAGEIIAFQSEGGVVTHRVVENRYVVGEFVTKGDANEREDLRTVPYAALVGRVAYHIPVLGAFLGIYASRVGKLYVLAFALCGVMFHLLAGRMRQRERERLRRRLEAELRNGESRE